MSAEPQMKKCKTAVDEAKDLLDEEDLLDEVESDIYVPSSPSYSVTLPSTDAEMLEEFEDELLKHLRDDKADTLNFKQDDGPRHQAVNLIRMAMEDKILTPSNIEDLIDFVTSHSYLDFYPCLLVAVMDNFHRDTIDKFVE